MGLDLTPGIHGEDVITVHVESYPVFAESGENGSEAVLYAIAQNSSIPGRIMESFANGITVDMEQYYQYGKKFHPWGLPNIDKVLFRNTVTQKATVSILAEHYNQPITNFRNASVEYFYGYNPQSPYDSVHLDNDITKEDRSTQITWEQTLIWLQYYIGYNSYDLSVDSYKANNNLNFKAFPGILNSEINDYHGELVNINNVRYEPYNTYDEYFTAITVYRLVGDLKFHFTHLTTGVVTETNVEFNDAALHEGYFIFNHSFQTDYLVIKYLNPVDADDAELRQYIYPFEGWRTYTYELATKAENIIVDKGRDYYPILPLRVDRGQSVSQKSVDKDKITQNFYDKTKELGKRLDIDIDSLVESLEENPSQGDMNGAYVTVGARINADNRYELAYVYDYFHDQREEDLGSGTSSWDNYFRMYENDGGNFAQYHGFGKIEKTAHSGKMKSDFSHLPYQHKHRKQRKLVGDAGAVGTFCVWVSSYYIGYDDYDGTYEREVYVYNIGKQISKNYWKQIAVSDLVQKTYVYDGEAEVLDPNHLFKSTLTDPKPDPVSVYVVPMTFESVLRDTEQRGRIVRTDGKYWDKDWYQVGDPVSLNALAEGDVNAEEGNILASGQYIIRTVAANAIEVIGDFSEIVTFIGESIVGNPVSLTQGSVGSILPQTTERTPTDQIRLPIQRSRMKKYDSRTATKIFTGATNILITAYDKSHLAWHQNKNIQLIIKIVGIVLTFITLGTAGVLYTIISTMIALVVVEIFKLLAEVIGGNLAKVLAAVIIVVAVIFGKGEYAFKALQYANQAIQAISLFASAAMQFTQVELDELQQRIDDYTKDAEEILAEQKEARDLLTVDPLDPYGQGLLDYEEDVIVNESPDTFYARTTHIMNPGVLILDGTREFFDRQFELPDLLEDNPIFYPAV